MFTKNTKHIVSRLCEFVIFFFISRVYFSVIIFVVPPISFWYIGNLFRSIYLDFTLVIVVNREFQRCVHNMISHVYIWNIFRFSSSKFPKKNIPTKVCVQINLHKNVPEQSEFKLNIFNLTKTMTTETKAHTYTHNIRRHFSNSTV